MKYFLIASFLFFGFSIYTFAESIIPIKPPVSDKVKEIEALVSDLSQQDFFEVNKIFQQKNQLNQLILQRDNLNRQIEKITQN